MTQEDKDLLFKDLCARLPYGVKCHFKYGSAEDDVTLDCIDKNVARFEYGWYGRFHVSIDANYIKPYLRPMSSMTEEECMELSKIRPFDDDVEAWKYIKTPVPLKIANIKHFDFFHSHHLDWRGLIEKGLALEAPEEMYEK